MRIAHIITGLDRGGAEMMLLRLAERLKPDFDQFVVTLGKLGPVGKRLQALNIDTIALNLSSRFPDPRAVHHLASILKRMQPDVVQTWLYHADLLGGVAARSAGIRAVAWNIRVSNLPSAETAARTRAVAWMLARLSRKIPARIVCCSRIARQTHIAKGYDAERFEFIPNGFDTTRLRPDPAARASVRAELGLGEDIPLVGLIARFHPQKNHAGFFRAAEQLRRDLPNANFLLAGRGAVLANPQLMAWIEKAGLQDRTHLLGDRDDIPRLTAALDVASSCSSWGEAFPNVLAEAMACGVPCVTTNVGDAAFIVGETGRVVAREDMRGLAEAWRQTLSMDAVERARLGEQARARVRDLFDIGQIAERYACLYERMAHEAGRRMHAGPTSAMPPLGRRKQAQA